MMEQEINCTQIAENFKTKVTDNARSFSYFLEKSFFYKEILKLDAAL